MAGEVHLLLHLLLLEIQLLCAAELCRRLLVWGYQLPTDWCQWVLANSAWIVGNVLDRAAAFVRNYLHEHFEAIRL